MSAKLHFAPFVTALVLAPIACSSEDLGTPGGSGGPTQTDGGMGDGGRGQGGSDGSAGGSDSGPSVSRDGGGDASPEAGIPTFGTIGLLSAGALNTCVVTKGQTLKCWGNNRGGGLGDGTLDDHITPFDVPGLTGVESVSTGTTHSCAITTGGGVSCWGKNDKGQLGRGTATGGVFTPAPVPNLSGITRLAILVDATCAFAAGTGTVWCWGSNATGQIGKGFDNRHTDYFSPAVVTSLQGAIGIHGDNYYGCAPFANGTVKCWGSGDHSFSRTPSPPGVPKSWQEWDPVGFPEFTGITHFWGSGNNHCGNGTSSVQRCWGNQSLGALGDGKNGGGMPPQDVTVLGERAVQFAPSDSSGCALLASGTVKCWGYGQFGELGDGSINKSRYTAEPVLLPSKAVAVTSGVGHVCALLDTDAVYCWGSNRYGQVGDGGNSAAHRVSPVLVTTR